MNKERFESLDLKINKSYSNVAGIVISQEGERLYEGYFNSCSNESYLPVYSVTKSIISILFGIAVDQGLIKDLDQKVLDFFPDHGVPTGNKTIGQVTLKHLLTMTAPFKYGLFPLFVRYFTSKDWVDFSLNILGGRGKVGKFRYTPVIGPDILSGVLFKVTGKSPLELANEYLFQPLKIAPKEMVQFESKEEQMTFNKSTTTSGWAADSKGINAAGWGLTLSAEEMVKIGELILNRGEYNSKRIVSEGWIENLTSVHSKWDQHNLSYGLLWWVIDVKKGVYAAMGDGGNIIYINRSKQLVVSINSLFVHGAKDRIKFIQKHIEDCL